MIKLLLSNLRELVVFLLVACLLLFCLDLLGRAGVAANGPLSSLVSVATSIVGGLLKFVAVMAFAWFGLAVTFPEANRFIVSEEFDGFWLRTPTYYKGYVSLLAVAVLAIVAAICMAA